MLINLDGLLKIGMISKLSNRIMCKGTRREDVNSGRISAKQAGKREESGRKERASRASAGSARKEICKGLRGGVVLWLGNEGEKNGRGEGFSAGQSKVEGGVLEERVSAAARYF